ncbi:transposase [Streptomyces sp. NPDC002838]|uniref:transposase n=1 Tax=Streptomyces sp. NPDC002838 TaxID=3154436 RepID=UPI003327269F
MVVVDALDRPYVVGGAHPPPVLRRLHTAVLAISVRRHAHEIDRARLRLPPLPQPRDDFLLLGPEQGIGGQHDPDRHRHVFGRVVGSRHQQADLASQHEEPGLHQAAVPPGHRAVAPARAALLHVGADLPRRGGDVPHCHGRAPGRRREGPEPVHQTVLRGAAPEQLSRRCRTPGAVRDVAVFAAYASRRGRTLVDRELYLPKSWTSDRERCRAAKVPDSRGFATKTELARILVTRAAGRSVAHLLGDRGCPLRSGLALPPHARGSRPRVRRGGAEVAADQVSRRLLAHRPAHWRCPRQCMGAALVRGGRQGSPRL